MIKNFLFIFSTFLVLDYATIPALAVPRLAVIAENEDAKPASDMLTAQLSKSKDYAVLERDEIAKLFREQQITLEGLAEHSDLSRLTGADGLILLRPMEKGNQKLLVARIVAVHPGVVLDSLSCPLPCADYDAWASLISTRVKQLSPKFEVLARDAIAVSILNIRAEYESGTIKSLEQNMNKLLFARLIQEPRLFVLERQNLEKLDWEKKISLKSEEKFWTAGYILEGSFNALNTNNIALNVNLLGPDGTRLANIVTTGAVGSVESIVDQTTVKILKALQIVPSAVFWSPKDEAERYYQEAIWADRWKLYPESISAIESSWALGNQTEEAAFQRLQCYLHSFSAQQAGGNLTTIVSNERMRCFLQALSVQPALPLVVRRLLELYLEYRRMFPQKSLTLAPYIERPDEARWLPHSLDKDSERAHYYRDVINAASILLQKERQYPNWEQQYHDALADIRSLTLAVCREIDVQAEKEKITSPIKDIIIKQGYYWYESPRDYVAALYRSLEGRNGSRGTMFHAISGYKNCPYLVFGWPPDARQTFFNWPDKVLQAFDHYGPEFNQKLCHSTNSVNRLIGHYCELKWAKTNIVAVTESMDYLMDDLWESRDFILAPNSRFILFLMQHNINGPDSDFYNYFHLYLEPFRLWKEKAVILPYAMRAQYNDKILAFHRRFLLYAIGVGRIPFGLFRPILEEHLNMSLEEGQSFYDAHFNRPASAQDDIRTMFYVVYKSKQVPINAQERPSTNAFQIKIDHDSLTTAMVNYLTKVRDPSKMSQEEKQSFYDAYYTNLGSAPDYIRSMFSGVVIKQKTVKKQVSRSTNFVAIASTKQSLAANSPRPTITTSPCPSLAVTRYYSLPGQIQNIVYANDKVWVALPDRLLVLDENSFSNNVIHAVKSPEIQWIGSNLFLDTGPEITCLAPDNRVIKKWLKPNRDEDFQFYIYKDHLYLFKEDLMISVDLKTGDSQVIASRRRKPPQTLLDGSDFTINRVFASSSNLLALIKNGPKGDGVYAFCPATKIWWLEDAFPMIHITCYYDASYLMTRSCQAGMLFFNANFDGTGVEVWSPTASGKQLLMGLNYGVCKSRWALPEDLPVEYRYNCRWESNGKTADYDGNNLFLLTAPQYDDYHVLLWVFEKDRETGFPIQLLFLTNHMTRSASVIQTPTIGAIAGFHVNDLRASWTKPCNTAKYMFIRCSKGLIMAMNKATGFWFIPIEDMHKYMNQNPALLPRKLDEHVKTYLSDRYPIPGQPCAVDLGGGIKLEMEWIPPGEFIMGSPASEWEREGGEDQHKVIIPKGFWIGKHELTQGQWFQLMKTNPSQFRGTDLPVDGVSWVACRKFISKLNVLFCNQNSTARNFQFSLPTEEEWEYACRAGTTSRYYTGESVSDLDRAGWYERNSGGATHPVGQKQPNSWGLYDMLGNVSEWCMSWFERDEPVLTEAPKAIKFLNSRIYRGGSIYEHRFCCRSARRFFTDPDDTRVRGKGFRIVLHP